MNPIIQNLLATLIGLVYVFSVVGIMDFAVKKGFPQDISRKIVHIAAGSWLIFWPLYDLTHWSRYLNIAPAFIWTLLLLIKGFTAKPDDKAVKTMTRTGDRRELLKGPLYFTLVMNLMGTLFLYSPVALTSMGFLGWGDGLAPVFGNRFGKLKFNFLSEKSVEGSITFLIFGLLASILFNYFFFLRVDLMLLLICAGLTTLVEALSPKDMDNILIPLACIVFYYFTGNI